MSGKPVFFIIITMQALCQVLRPCESHRPAMPQHFQQHSEEQKHGGYNPTHGHEPYWEDGDWVLMEQKPKPNATTTRKPTLVCGDVCPYIYREVKHVCARLSNNLVFGGCTSGDCRGNWIDDLTSGFHTFDTYCDFLNAQCRSPFTDKWMFLHSGKCITKVSDYLKPISVGQQLLSRITHYYTELSKARASHSLPPIEF